MANKNALLDELKGTPVEYLQEIAADNDIEILSEDQVSDLLGEAKGLAPEIEIAEVITDQDPDTDEETDADQDPDTDEDTDPDTDEETDADQDPDAVNPDEPTEIEMENFLTPDLAIGFLDNTMVAVEGLIFQLADVEVNKKDLHYTAKQKKLLKDPLAKALKQSKVRIKSPWGAFFATFLGLEATKIGTILTAGQIEKKHRAEYEDLMNNFMTQQQQMVEMQQYIIYLQQQQQPGMNPQPQQRQQPPQPQQQRPQPQQQQNNNSMVPGTGPIRDDKGKFMPGTGQVPRTGRNRKHKSTRKPGETRGRKTKGQTIEFSNTGS